MSDKGPSHGRFGARITDAIGGFAQRRSGWAISGIVLITLLLLLPLFFMAPTQMASDRPGGEVFDLEDKMVDRFPLPVFGTFFIVEARDGDMLTRDSLWELYQNEERLRRSALGQEYLYERYDPESGQITQGVYTMADAVNQALLSQGVTLEQATDEQVKAAVHYVAQDPRTSALTNLLSVKATEETGTFAGRTITVHRSPALGFQVNADNDKLGGGGLSITLGGDETALNKERFSRDVQALLRGDQQSYQLWGVAIDLNLESQEEGARSFPLVILAIIVILLIVGLHFRSPMTVGLVALGLGMLIVWLKGISNLIGIKGSLVLDIIVPIAILSLGVDYAIHALHRYREERRGGAEPAKALGRGVGGVGGALILAMLTTVAAFLSNVTSGVESIVQFGIAAGVAIFAALIIMGLFVPAARMRLERRRLRGADPTASISGLGHRGELLGMVAGFLAQRRWVVLALALILTGFAVFYAQKLEARLEAKEALDGRSDFVVSLDKLDEHMGRKGGEPALIYVEGDFTRPQALLGMRQVVTNMEDDRTVARRTSDGRPDAYVSLFDFLDAVLESEVARARIEAASPGLRITDEDGDGLPDTQDQLKAIYDYISRYGIPLNAGILQYEPSAIAEAFFHDPESARPDATMIVIGIPGTREQAVVKESRAELEEDMKALEGREGISYYGLTGSGYIRDASMDATTRSLTRSLMVAGVLCLVILMVALRSVRYGVVTVIPMLLVVAWLYAFMHLGGFHLNAITATIAAISIGVGIDYSIHITARFREELARSPDRISALRRAASESGSALFGSAASTALGFAVIGLAPMPIFASFGILTAVMIVMAFAAALLVLPSLLLLVTPEKTST